MNHNRLPRNQVTGDSLGRLWDGTSLVGRTDDELLARFVANGDEAAFEGLVVRLGPMVLGVCRRMLGARPDADDAFQATFLVLVRRARTVGRGDLIGPWLHEVAVRVCRKARAQAARRRTREGTGLAVAELLPIASTPALDQAETRAVIDDAIARLPTSYRRLIVLCDVEELTRDEAADRLGWTSNMVRGRLARARSQLRRSLVRRGCVPPGFRPSSAETDGSAAVPWLLTPPPDLVATTARAALALNSPSGRQVVAGLASTTALHLAEGVIRTMVYSSWKFVGSTLILGGSLAAGTAGVLLAQAPAPVAQAPAPVAPSPPQAGPAAQQQAIADQLDNLFLAAQYRYAAIKKQYETRDETVYGVLAGSQSMMEAELALNADPKRRELALQLYLDRTKELLANQTRRLAVGYTTRDNVDAVTRASRDALALLERSRTPGAVIAASPSLDVIPEATMRDLENRLTLARENFEIQLESSTKAKGTIRGVLVASRRLMRAALAMAFTPYERRAAVQTHVEQVERIFKNEQERVLDGEGNKDDEAEAQRVLTDAQALLANQPDGLHAPLPEAKPVTDLRPQAPSATPIAPTTAARQIAESRQTKLKLAREMVAEAKRLDPAGTPELEYLQAASDLAEAKLAVATTPGERAATLQAQITLAQQVVAAAENGSRRGEKSTLDVVRAKIALLDAQTRAAGSGTGLNSPATADFDRRLSDVERKLDQVLDRLDSISDRPQPR